MAGSGPAKLVGARVKRVEDPRLLMGKGNYIDDIKLPNMVHAFFLRSPYAHAKIISINTSTALNHPGVIAILTGEEAARKAKPLQARLHEAPGFERLARAYKLASWYPLGLHKVRFVGEAVAAVMAGDRYVAEDAAELIEVDYEPLPAVTNVEEAMGEDAPLLYEDWQDNIMLRAEFQTEDIEKAFEEADHIFRERFKTNRCAGLSIETRGCVADFHRDSGSLTIWSSTQIPHVLRMTLAEALSFPENKLRVIAPDIGGGFGIKSHVFPEEIAVCLCAMKLGRPVKWIEDRRENLLSAIQAREGVFYLEMAVKKDGTILGLKAKIISDAGAYPAFPGTSNEPLHMSTILTGPYKIRSYAYELYNVVTNKAPLGPYRGVGAPMATYVGEHMVDIVARELDADPAEVRLRNFVQPHEFPYTSATGLVYESGSYVESLKKALEMVHYHSFRKEQQEAKEKGKYLGLGIASYVELTAPGSMFYAIWDASGFDLATLRLSPSGKVNLIIGMPCPGQGYETTLVQLMADELGVDMADVTVTMGDTSATPFSWGSHSSRFTVVCGGAAILAARKVKEKVLRIASHMMGVRPAELELKEGKVLVKGAPSKAVSLRDVAGAAILRPYLLPEGMEMGLEASASYEPPPLSSPNATHIVIVEVDIETGFVKIIRYVVAHDCGRMVNPMIVEGQIRGGTTQGIGNALYEDLVYDAYGQLLTATLMDYTIPTAAEVPDIEIAHLETPSPLTIGGVKGMGEGGAIAPAGAIANAVADALFAAGMKAKLTQLPLTPYRVFKIIQAAKANPR